MNQVHLLAVDPKVCPEVKVGMQDSYTVYAEHATCTACLTWYKSVYPGWALSYKDTLLHIVETARHEYAW